MKNDLDFIRDKIENSGVKAPDDMDERYVAHTLEGVTPQPVVVPPKRRRTAAAIAISATAAGLVMVIALGVILSAVFKEKKASPVSLPGGLELRQFQTRDEIADELTKLKSNQTDSYWYNADRIVEDYGAGQSAAEDRGSSGSADTATGGSADSGQKNTFSETYKQVDGVDEADIIKTDGKYIYCVESGYSEESKVVIFTADGKDSKRAAEIDVFASDGATRDEADEWDYFSKSRYIIDMYLKDDRLIVVCDDMTGQSGHVVNMAEIKVYDVSDIHHITELDSFSQRGSCDSSRMIGDTLYLVSSYSPFDSNDIPVCGRGETLDELPADCIYALDDHDTKRFLVLSAYDTLDASAQTESKSILGKVDDIYCNLDHMYIYAAHYETKRYGNINLFKAEPYEDISSQILKVDLSDGITFSAYTEIDGVIDDQYALDEYDGCLRVATTSATVQESNNLFVLDENLSVIGSVNGFARNESIKAVRYVGDTAYVITYEQTDPLFVIDLTVPTDPKILGEAKISGFSTMLVPIDENTLLGLGYHTSDSDFSEMEVQDGFKLVLFDVTDKLNPKVLDTLIYEECSSEVQYNPKALVYNSDRDDYIIPLNYAHWSINDSEFRDDVYTGAYYGGVLNFKVEDDRLKEVGRYKADYDAVDRCVYVGDTVYMTYHDAKNNYELKIDAVSYR